MLCVYIYIYMCNRFRFIGKLKDSQGDRIRTPCIAMRTPVPVYEARKDKVNIERGGRGYCIVIPFKLGRVIGRAYKYLECNGCPDQGSSATCTHSRTSVICRESLLFCESMPYTE